MTNRIIDKTILLILCSILYAVLFEKGVDRKLVIAFLFAIIFGVLAELAQRRLSVWILTFVATVAALCEPVFFLASNMVMYSLWHTEQCVQVIWGIDKKRSRGEKYDLSVKTFIITAALFLLFSLVNIIALIFSQGIHGGVYVAVFVLLTLLISVKTVRYETLNRVYYDKCDELRLDALNARKDRYAAFKQNEENVYMATLSERNRIAREIHDNVGHLLTRAIVQMQAIKIINKDENTKPYLESVDETINSAMLNIRKSVHELHDDSLDMSVMLGEVIKALPERFKVTLKTSIESATGTDLKNSIVGIVREGITNIAKYSNGDNVKVEVIEHAAFWRIYIFDNGSNPEKDYTRPASLGGEGIGLQNIVDRAKRYNGNVNISSDEKGFMILVTLPKKS